MYQSAQAIGKDFYSIPRVFFVDIRNAIVMKLSDVTSFAIAFLAIALLLGDGLYIFIKIISVTLISSRGKIKQKKLNREKDETSKTENDEKMALEDLKKNEFFLRESIPMWVAAVGYGFFAHISIIVIPFIFPMVRWYYVFISYAIVPSLAFCNAYGAGLTDMNMSYHYGKVGLFVLAALAGKQHGVVAGLVGFGIMKLAISVSCVLMQDLKTGHLTLTSPKAMLAGQAIGTAIGCVVAPLSFFMFYQAFDVGNPDGEYKAPFVVVFRNMAILGVEGFSALPNNCLQLCGGFFACAVLINLMKDFSSPRIGKWMPLPMAMAIPFLVGAYFAVDLFVGSSIVFVWHKLNPKRADVMASAVASGLIGGEGLWVVPASVLSLAKINPPICMNFLPP